MALVSEAQAGRLSGLRALRDLLAGEISDCEQRNLAALSRQLRDVLADIDALERQSPKKSRVDELASRRKARRSDAKGVAVPSEGVDGGAGGG